MADLAVIDNRIIIWRVRQLSCDGGQIGKSWEEKFFMNRETAEDFMQKRINQNNERNPQYLFKDTLENIEGIVGRCNWQFGSMIALDSFEIVRD